MLVFLFFLLKYQKIIYMIIVSVPGWRLDTLPLPPLSSSIDLWPLGGEPEQIHGQYETC